MNQELLVRSLLWLFRSIALLGVICGYQIAHAQAPPNLSGIAGRTIKVTVISASGVAFAGTAGSQCRLLPSASGASYDIVPVPATSAISPSTGTIQNYSVNGSGNVATLSLYDTVFGLRRTLPPPSPAPCPWSLSPAEEAHMETQGNTASVPMRRTTVSKASPLAV